MSGQQWEQKIDRYLSGDSRGEEPLRAHLTECDRCRVFYDAGVLALRAARGGSAAGLGELERLIRRAEGLAARRPARSTRPETSDEPSAHP